MARDLVSMTMIQILPDSAQTPHPRQMVGRDATSVVAAVDGGTMEIDTGKFRDRGDFPEFDSVLAQCHCWLEGMERHCYLEETEKLVGVASVVMDRVVR